MLLILLFVVLILWTSNFHGNTSDKRMIIGEVRWGDESNESDSSSVRALIDAGSTEVLLRVLRYKVRYTEFEMIGSRQ